LLRLREAVDLVEEQNRSLASFAEAVTGTLDGAAHVLHAGVHCGELLEGACSAPRNGQRECGLAGAGWTPQQHRRESVGLHQRTQWPSRPDEMVLSDNVVDRTRPKACGERCA
jgi:hypothetical protein